MSTSNITESRALCSGRVSCDAFRRPRWCPYELVHAETYGQERMWQWLADG